MGRGHADVVTDSPRPIWRGRALALSGIILLAMSLRTAVASLAPLLGIVESDFPLPAAVVGAIGTAPPVMYAVFGIITPALERRWGLERLAAVAMAVAALGLVGRALAFDALSLVAATTVIFAAVGVGNVLLPPLVKKYFPDRIGLLTTIYTTVLAVSTSVPPLVAVPVADAAGWRASLGLWSVFAAVALIPWAVLVLGGRKGAPPSTGSHRVVEGVHPSSRRPALARTLWRLPRTWAITATFAISGIVAYTSFTWLPRILIDTALVGDAESGALVALFAAVGLPASLAVPILAVRFRAVGVIYVISCAGGLGGAAGLLIAPSAAPIVWVVLLGLGTMVFPLVFVLLNVRTETHRTAVALSGFVQGVGYAIVAAFPVTIGIVHELTQSWTFALVTLAIVLTLLAPAGVIASRPTTVEEEWRRREVKEPPAPA